MALKTSAQEVETLTTVFLLRSQVCKTLASSPNDQHLLTPSLFWPSPKTIALSMELYRVVLFPTLNS